MSTRDSLKLETVEIKSAIHYAEAEDGVIPNRFACGKVPSKDDRHWTSYPWIVSCQECHRTFEE